MATTAPEPHDAATAYQSLYRRYRPQRFSEVRGQEHVALALRNAVRDGRVAHAYLFSGPRGTGKTSTARILAKALDCESPEDGEPCGQCPSCLAITAGSSFDVHELDAASNNGVDAMRDLVARSTLATPGRWKVYIVDEVHMLSTAASNALLKTLEEPPEHVVFVLATTDPQKVLPTIRSRTQHYEFHLINESTLDELLDDVARDAGLTLPEGALEAAVRRARGSARDALSVLDQVVAAGLVEDSGDVLNEIVIAMGESDTAALLIAINAAMDAGHDPQQLGVDVIERLRAGFLAQFNSNTAMPLSEAERDQVLALGTAGCVRAMELIGTAIVAMRDAPEPRITLEVAMIRCAHPEAETSVEALAERIERIERRLAESPQTPVIAPPVAAPPIAVPPITVPAAHAATTAPAPATASPTPALPTPTSAPPAASPPRSTTEVKPEAAPTPAPRPSLGAFRRGERADGPAREPDATDGITRGAAATGAAETAASGESPGGAPPTGETETTAPSLDAIVHAWESQILPGLRPKARAIYQATRFVGIEGNVVHAGLPNEAHIRHAEPLRGDIEAALSAHFSTPIALRLVAGPPASASTVPTPPGGGGDPPARRSGPAPARSTAPPPPVEEEEYVADPDDVDFTEVGPPLSDDDLAERAGTNIAWATDQLRAAFPGAEEIQS